MASRRARRRRRHPRHIALRIFLVFLIAVLLLSGAATTVAYATVTTWLQDLPDANAAKVAQVTKIYSADGKLLARLYLENREVVPLDKMSKHVKNGVIAVEDERFYQHQGYDIVGIVRALVKDITAGNVREGASTLTQQYVRQTLLQREATKITIARKIREIYLAQELEKRYSKDEILAMYLNTVYFGDGAYGIEAASKHYFNKSAKDLDIAQAAMLAGIPQSPTRLTPTVKDNAKRSLERQHWVLAKMLEQGYITQAEHKKALAEKLRYQAAPEEGDGIYQAPYFVSYVKKQLQDMYGTSMVFKGGLKVYTTLDTRMQRDAERARDHKLDESGDPEAAVVSIDPKTGYVKAMVGGRNFAKN
jgi:penicillin-binding protein 1A